MLKKILKYDLKAIYKPLIIFYLIFVVCAILSQVFSHFQNTSFTFILYKFFQGATNGFIIGAIINNAMNLWEYTRQNFYGDRSYLTHTLPIPRHTLLMSKFLTTIITIFTTILLGAVAIFIANVSPEILNFIGMLFDTYGVATIIFKYVLPFALIIYLEFVFIAECGITGVIIGNRFNNHKILFSIISGFVIFWIADIITVLGMLLAGCFNPEIAQIFTTNEANGDIVLPLCYIGSAFYAIYITAMCYVNTKLLNRGINVD